MRIERPFTTGFLLALGVAVGMAVLPLLAAAAAALGFYWLVNVLG